LEPYPGTCSLNPTDHDLYTEVMSLGVGALLICAHLLTIVYVLYCFCILFCE